MNVGLRRLFNKFDLLKATIIGPGYADSKPVTYFRRFIPSSCPPPCSSVPFPSERSVSLSTSSKSGNALKCVSIHEDFEHQCGLCVCVIRSEDREREKVQAERLCFANNWVKTLWQEGELGAL